MNHAVAINARKVGKNVVRIQVRIQIERTEYTREFYLVQYIPRKCRETTEVKLHIVAQNESLCLLSWQLIEDGLHISPSLEKNMKFTVEACKQCRCQYTRVASDTTGRMDSKRRYAKSHRMILANAA